MLLDREPGKNLKRIADRHPLMLRLLRKEAVIKAAAISHAVACPGKGCSRRDYHSLRAACFFAVLCRFRNIPKARDQVFSAPHQIKIHPLSGHPRQRHQIVLLPQRIHELKGICLSTK